MENKYKIITIFVVAKTHSGLIESVEVFIDKDEAYNNYDNIRSNLNEEKEDVELFTSAIPIEVVYEKK